MDSVDESSDPASYDVDEWDENFINAIFQAELGLSKKNLLAKPAAPPPLLNPSSAAIPAVSTLPVKPNSYYLPKQDVCPTSHPIREEGGGPPSSGLNVAVLGDGYSPPREWSQRTRESSKASKNGDHRLILNNRVSRDGVCNREGVGRKNVNVERLKKDLERLSKKCTQMEQDCIKLKKDRDAKSEQLKCFISQLEAKDAAIHTLKRKYSEIFIQDQSHPSKFESKTLSSFSVETDNFKSNDFKQDGSVASEVKRYIVLDDNATTSCGAQECSSLERGTKIKHLESKGIQTNISKDSTKIIQQKRLLIEHGIVSNLHAIWHLRDKRSGSTLVSKLLRTCSEDFFALFRCINTSSNSSLNGLPNEGFTEMALHGNTRSIFSSDGAKISQFYQSLMKMRYGVVSLQTVIDALLVLCNFDNATVVHVSLRILHATLQHLGFDPSSQRSNVFVGQSSERSSLGCGDQMADNANEAMPASSFFESLCNNEDQASCSTMLMNFESLLNIFETIRKIVARNELEYIQLEGLSIMSLIVMESNSNTDREKFCTVNLLQTLSSLMNREHGVHVRKQAVRLLFLLFNSPKITLMREGDGDDHSEVDNTQKSTATLEGEIKSILENIAACLILDKSDAEELKFQRRVIILLAFVASSGKNGFELLLRPVTSQHINFLALIIQLVVFEMDAEMPDNGTIMDFGKERISLIREALILLNRLTSHPIYSDTALRALTSTKSTLNLTIDVANRLMRRIQGFLKQAHGTKRTPVPAEVADLARLFRLRIFSFLGMPIC